MPPSSQFYFCCCAVFYVSLFYSCRTSTDLGPCVEYDSSDESREKWQCKDQMSTVECEKLCDGRKDCNDGSDEVGCIFGTKKPAEYCQVAGGPSRPPNVKCFMCNETDKVRTNFEICSLLPRYQICDNESENNILRDLSKKSRYCAETVRVATKCDVRLDNLRANSLKDPSEFKMSITIYCGGRLDQKSYCHNPPYIIFDERTCSFCEINTKVKFHENSRGDGISDCGYGDYTDEPHLTSKSPEPEETATTRVSSTTDNRTAHLDNHVSLSTPVTEAGKSDSKTENPPKLSSTPDSSGASSEKPSASDPQHMKTTPMNPTPDVATHTHHADEMSSQSPEPEHGGHSEAGISTGAVAGISIGVFILVALVISTAIICVLKSKEDSKFRKFFKMLSFLGGVVVSNRLIKEDEQTPIAPPLLRKESSRPVGNDFKQDWF